MTRVEKAIKIRPAGWVHPFARLVPESWRRAHHWYAVRNRKFWLPCSLCGHEFGGHEWRTVNGLSADIADPKYPAGSGRGIGICPACTRAGRGVDTLLAVPEEDTRG